MYHKKAHIHFVGIGGIGMSGIAHILRQQGYTISGCDLDVSQQSIINLTHLGCSIFPGNNNERCHDASIDVLVYSSAVAQETPEIVAARKRGIPTIPRALMLAELMRTKYSIAIAGSHGKTTTTSLISHLLIEAHIDPTVIIGGHLKSISSNARLGNGDFLVAEADESDRSFTHLFPTIAVITNIDLEHLETYKDLDDIRATFARFLSNIPFYGKAIVCVDDPQVRSILPIDSVKIVSYGIDNPAMVMASKVELGSDYSRFNLVYKGTDHGQVFLPIPGKHNVLNSLAALALATDLEVPLEKSIAALATFKGVDRRFTFKGVFSGAEFFDDYGHHPVEIYHTLQVAKRRNRGKLFVVFQPHRYTRTEKLWDHFVNTFAASGIDGLIITDIYPASELPIAGVTSERLVEAIRSAAPDLPIWYASYDRNFSTIKNILLPLLTPNDLVLLQGAGALNKLVDTL